MIFYKSILILLFYFFFVVQVNAFTDNDGDGPKSTGREDLSFLKAHNSDFKKGKDAFKQAIKYEKKNKIKKANDRFEKALKYFVSANVSSSNDVEILYYLGFVYNKVGDLMMSEIYYMEGLNNDPKNSLINKELGKLYFKTNRINLAKKRLKVLSSCDCREFSELKKIIAGKKN